MGLDVYLKRFEDFADWYSRRTECDQRTNAAWEQAGAGKSYDQMTKEEKEQASTQAATIEAELGMDDEAGMDEISLPSVKHPDHSLFRIGYFRSSYNDVGIERVGKQMMGYRPLAFIFPHEEDALPYIPVDWQSSRAACIKAIDDYKQASETFPYRCFSLGRTAFPHDDTPASQEEALEMVRKALERDKKNPSPAMFGRAYSNGHGYFDLDGIKVTAIIHGNQESIMARVMGQRRMEPVVYVVYQASDDAWYLEALEIVLETIDWVLAQPDPSQFRLYWSG